MIEQKIKNIYERFKPELKNFHFNLELKETLKEPTLSKFEGIKKRLDEHRYEGKHMDSGEEEELQTIGLLELIEEGRRVLDEFPHHLKESEELYKNCFHHFLIDKKGNMEIIEPKIEKDNKEHILMHIDINEVRLNTTIPRGLKKDDLFKLEPEDYSYSRLICQEITGNAKKQIEELAEFLDSQENIELYRVNFLCLPTNGPFLELGAEEDHPQKFKLSYYNLNNRTLIISAYYPEKVNFAKKFLEFFEYRQKEFASINQKNGFEAFHLLNEREKLELTAHRLSWILKEIASLENMFYTEYQLDLKSKKRLPQLTRDFLLEQQYSIPQRTDIVGIETRINGIDVKLNIGHYERCKHDQLLIYIPAPKLGEGTLDRIIYSLGVL